MDNFPNYIQKMLDEYDIKNPPKVLNEKRALRKEIEEIVGKLSEKADPVFKEFSDNPLAEKTSDELLRGVNEFKNIANSNEQICKPAKNMILSFSNMHIYHCFCEMENILRNKDLNFEDLVINEFLMDDLVNYCYDVKQQMDISTKDLLCYTYYLGFKNYTGSFFIPSLKYITTNKPKFHLNLSKRKRSSIYKIFQDQKDFIKQDQVLNKMYKYFIGAYKDALFLKEL